MLTSFSRSRPWIPGLLGALVLAAPCLLAASPVIPGLGGKHGLDEAEMGRLLIDELRCAACHDGIGTSPAPSAPDLRVTAAFIQPDFVEAFIADPAGHDPGTTMPALLQHLSPKERGEESAALAAYVNSLAPKKPDPLGSPDEVGAERNAGKGKELFHEVGCIACHSPRDGDEVKDLLSRGDVGLGHLPAKYHEAGLAHFLHLPLKARPAGRMPDMRLTPAEAASLATYLLTNAKGPKDGLPSDDDALIARGRESFQRLQCAACHQVGTGPGLPENLAPPRARLRLDKGCLSDEPGTAPSYNLSMAQRKAIVTALKGPVPGPDPGTAIKTRLTQLNCIACHQRDDYGGVAADRDSYFHSTQEGLGNESRIPPPLTLVGAKLKPAWLGKVLYEGERVRPYMTTRMPLYGEQALAGLTEWVAQADQLPPVEFPPPDRESGPMLRNGGHLLVGDKGLNCIACHNFNGKDGPGMKGIDLMTTYQRLQPEWFDGFLRNPAQFRPGIIMPSYWPGGKAVQTEILDGDTDEQLRALWHYLSLGRSARDPSGLVAKDNKLVVTDRTLTYRGRSSVAGYRGIAVGHPGGLNYAFNAQNGALGAIWQGEFVNVGWRGQGSGNFTPIGRPVQLAQDVAFLPDPAEPWPLRPMRSKEVPVNPDPRYPRQYGYSFKGYSLGEGDSPTFRYQIGEVAISDTALPVGSEAGPVLARSLTFTAPAATTLHLRALTGDIAKVDDTRFKTKGIELMIRSKPKGTETVLRPAAAENAQSELLIKLPLPEGTSSLTLDYVLPH